VAGWLGVRPGLIKVQKGRKYYKSVSTSLFIVMDFENKLKTRK
jgi:hypothetical protein